MLASIATFLAVNVTPAHVDVDLSGQLTLGDLIVGLGTLFLASFTWWLALSTRSSVQQAKQAIAAEDMPYVIPAAVPADTEVAIAAGRHQFPRCGVTDNGWLVVRLWNIGRGPAIVEDVRLFLDGSECLDAVFSHRPVHANGAHDSVWVNFHPPGDNWTARELSGTLTIIYAHANGTLWKTNSEVRLRDRRLVPDTFPRAPAASGESRTPSDPPAG